MNAKWTTKWTTVFVALLALVGIGVGASLARRRQAAIAEAELWAEAGR